MLQEPQESRFSMGYVPPKAPPAPPERTRPFPVVLLAHGRPERLNATLRSLLGVRGLDGGLGAAGLGGWVAEHQRVQREGRDAAPLQPVLEGDRRVPARARRAPSAG